jgi:hypothetical protein
MQEIVLLPRKCFAAKKGFYIFQAAPKKPLPEKYNKIMWAYR